MPIKRSRHNTFSTSTLKTLLSWKSDIFICVDSTSPLFGIQIQFQEAIWHTDADWVNFIRDALFAIQKYLQRKWKLDYCKNNLLSGIMPIMLFYINFVHILPWKIWKFREIPGSPPELNQNPQSFHSLHGNKSWIHASSVIVFAWVITRVSSLNI
jgi:hypothetical protein